METECDKCDEKHVTCCLCTISQCYVLGGECEECKKYYCNICAPQLLMYDADGKLNPWDENEFLFCGCHNTPDPNKDLKRRKGIPIDILNLMSKHLRELKYITSRLKYNPDDVEE